MKLTVCTDAHMLSKKVETKFEMLLDEYNTEKLILIGMPLELLPLNCDGLPLIVQKIYDYIVDYGLYDECLFDDMYCGNGRKESIINAYELVSNSELSCRTIIDVDAKDVATVLVIWLYYLPKPLLSVKQFSMICDLNINTNHQEIMNSLDNISKQTLQQIISIVDSYGKQHKLYKEKLESLFTLLLTKNVDIANQSNTLQFIDNLKTLLINVKTENDHEYKFNKCLVIKENDNEEENIFNKNNLCNEKNIFNRLLSDDGLQLKDGVPGVNTAVKTNTSKKSSTCNLLKYISKENHYDYSFNEEHFKTESTYKLTNDIFQDSSNSVVDEFFSSQIDDMRNVERTMPTHSRSIIRQNKKKSIKSHVEKVLKSGFLSYEDSLLLQNTLELMNILSKIKSVQNQINIQKGNCDGEFNSKNEDGYKHFPELYFLNNRLEHLVKQKNNCLSKTGLSYGRLYNRTVLNLKKAQKKAFKLHEDDKNEKNSENRNTEKLISDIYNIQAVLDYLENNCGGKELPWRSSKGWPGYKRQTKKQLNCVTIVSDLQTISEDETMETIH